VARPLRENVEDGIYHAFARGNNQRLIFFDDADRRSYLGLLERCVRAMRWRCLAYCLMDNHVHLLLQTPHANLSAGVQHLHGHYAQRFNRRHGSVGHLFGGRYGAVRIGSDEHLWTAAVYIARNPVEAGLSKDPEDWPWSSYRATLRSDPTQSWLDTNRLLSFFHESDRARAIDRFSKLVTAYGTSVKGLTPAG
jgi:putative transposase